MLASSMRGFENGEPIIHYRKNKTSILVSPIAQLCHLVFDLENTLNLKKDKINKLGYELIRKKDFDYYYLEFAIVVSN